MKRPLILLATLASLGTIVGDASAGCADAHMLVLFSGFQPEAVSRPLYWGVEGNSGTTTIPFTVALYGGDCSGQAVTAPYRTDAVTPNAADYTPAQGAAFFANTGAHSDSQPGQFQVTGEVVQDAPLEQAMLVLENPQGGATVGGPSSVPVVIVDDDGATARVSMLGGDYPHLEYTPSGGIPVFREGGATVAPINYTVAPDPAAPATEGADYTAQANGTLSFSGDDRVEMIPISVVNDGIKDPNERLQVSISGAEVAGGTQEATFTIVESAGVLGPTSSLHHPRQKLRYRADDYRIREIHIFTTPAGVEVIGARFALRRNMKGGDCLWLTGKRFRRGSCDDERWLITGKYEKDFFYFRLKRELKPSRGRIRNYTAFSIAQDGAGRFEVALVPGQNANTFEVRPPRRDKG